MESETMVWVPDNPSSGHCLRSVLPMAGCWGLQNRPSQSQPCRTTKVKRKEHLTAAQEDNVVCPRPWHWLRRGKLDTAFWHWCPDALFTKQAASSGMSHTFFMTALSWTWYPPSALLHRRLGTALPGAKSSVCSHQPVTSCAEKLKVISSSTWQSRILKNN